MRTDVENLIDDTTTTTAQTPDDGGDAAAVLAGVGGTLPGFLCVFNSEGRSRVHATSRLQIMLGEPVDPAPGPASSDSAEAETGFVSRALHPDDAPAFDQHVERLRHGARDGSASVEYRLRHRDGTWRWFLSSDADCLREPDGGARRVLCLAIDVTSRKPPEQAAPPLPPTGGALVEQTRADEQRRTEDAVRVTTERFAAALTASQVSVFEQDRDLRYTWIHNPTAGCHPRAITSQRDGELVAHPGDSAQSEAIKRAVLESGVGQRHEVPVVRDHVTYWCDLSVQPQRNAAGAIVGVTCAAVDITARKQAEADLSFLAELSKAFAPEAGVLDIARSAAERIGQYFRLSRCLLVEVSNTQEEATVFHDYSSQPQPELLGTYRIADYHTEDERRRLSAGQPVAIDDVSRAPRPAGAAARFAALQVGALANAPYVSAGRWRFVLSAMRAEPRPWRDHEVALLQDLAARTYLRIERARADEALHAAHDTLWHLVEHSPFGIYAVDADFRLVQVSAGAQKVFANVRPLLGRDFAEVLRVIWPEPFATEAIGHFRHTLDTGVPYHAPSTVERRQDIDEVESYDWKIERLALSDGRLGAVCHFYDLSERLRYEGALREADRQKDEFLAMLAHELRNPLAPIRTSVGVMRAHGSTDPLLVMCRDTIDRQAAQMARLLDDLLDVSRLSRGRLALQRAPVLLDDVLAAAVETARPLIDQRDQTLTVQHERGILLQADGARLTQVFANLLTNASKYSDPGGRIDVWVRKDPHLAVVQVCDNGSGIAPDMLDRVFDLFVQGNEAVGHGSGGLGIGLTLARRLVEMHGGTISAASSGLGCGSEFTVSLPLGIMPGPEEGVVAERPLATPRPRLRVLVVDDNVDAADTTAMLLDALGSEVRTAYDGLAALTEADAFQPGVVLLDIGMPGLDGFEVCRRIRARPWGGQAVLVAVSGWGRDEDRQRSADAGFDHHLMKPVDPGALLQVIRDATSGA